MRSMATRVELIRPTWMTHSAGKWWCIILPAFRGFQHLWCHPNTHSMLQPLEAGLCFRSKLRRVSAGVRPSNRWCGFKYRACIVYAGMRHEDDLPRSIMVVRLRMISVALPHGCCWHGTRKTSWSLHGYGLLRLLHSASAPHISLDLSRFASCCFDSHCSLMPFQVPTSDLP